MASPLFAHASNPLGRRKPKGLEPSAEMFLPAGYEGFDSVSRETLNLLRMSCAKRGKQVHRMMAANSARLSGIQYVSRNHAISSIKGSEQTHLHKPASAVMKVRFGLFNILVV